MHVLRNMVNAVRPGGVVLDLQVIRPNPLVEHEGRVLCEIDGQSLFALAEAASAAVDDLVLSGRLIEEAVDDHDVRKHYRTGADLVGDFANKERTIPPELVPGLRTLAAACIVRERCRLRRLRVPSHWKVTESSELATCVRRPMSSAFSSSGATRCVPVWRAFAEPSAILGTWRSSA